MLQYSCGECRYWEAFEGGSRGRCKRRSPMTLNAVTNKASWPVTPREEICGDFELRRVEIEKCLASLGLIDIEVKKE